VCAPLSYNTTTHASLSFGNVEDRVTITTMLPPSPPPPNPPLPLPPPPASPAPPPYPVYGEETKFSRCAVYAESPLATPANLVELRINLADGSAVNGTTVSRIDDASFASTLQLPEVDMTKVQIINYITDAGSSVDSYGSHTLVAGPYESKMWGPEGDEYLINENSENLAKIYIYEPTLYEGNKWENYFICYNFITGVWADFGNNSPDTLTHVGNLVTGTNDDTTGSTHDDLFAFIDPYAIPAPALFDGGHSTVAITTATSSSVGPLTYVSLPFINIVQGVWSSGVSDWAPLFTECATKGTVFKQNTVASTADKICYYLSCDATNYPSLHAPAIPCHLFFTVSTATWGAGQQTGQTGLGYSIVTDPDGDLVRMRYGASTTDKAVFVNPFAVGPLAVAFDLKAPLEATGGRLLVEDGAPSGLALYGSNDGGQNWTRVASLDVISTARNYGGGAHDVFGAAPVGAHVYRFVANINGLSSSVPQNQTLYNVFETFFSFVFFLIRGGRRANQENPKSNFVRF
jgi:hypothetical protein